MKTSILRLSVFLALTIVLANAAFALEKNKPVPSSRIEVVGAVKHPITLELRDLKEMKGVAARDCVMAGSHRGFVGIHNYRGALLRDVIDRAELEGKRKEMVIMVSAADGFRVAISWGELYNCLAGDHMIIAYERDGKLLKDDEGFARLIIPTDRYIADRAVKRVTKIEVKKAGRQEIR